MSNHSYESGLKTRKEVLGAEHVERTLRGTDDFSLAMQNMVTEHCWNDIWNREGLTRASRSLINLAIMSAMNRPKEFGTHVRAAINNGCTKEEIREVLLQVAVYCGMPVGLEAFRLAAEVFAQLEAEHA